MSADSKAPADVEALARFKLDLADVYIRDIWRVVPGPIRHLIEWAFVDLERAQGKP